MSISAPVVALAGNPNSGKTALFNALTGARQKVGNWPGVTVDKRSGHYSFDQNNFCVVDLPGTYSLSVTSEEGSIDQRIACDYLLSSDADLIVNVIDGSNLERNLYLTLQLIEMRLPVILAVNMMDVVEKQGIDLNLKKLSKTLGCPVVPLVASKRQGVDRLRKAIASMAKQPSSSSFQIPLLAPLTEAIGQLSDVLVKGCGLPRGDAPRNDRLTAWFAQRLLENDLLAEEQASNEALALADHLKQDIEMTTGEEPDILIADARYGAISEIVLAVTTLHKTKRQSLTEKIDRIVLNRFLGIPIFLGVMYLMFVFSINVGGAFQDFFDFSSTAIFVDGLAHGLSAIHAPTWLIALLANGIGKGINTVVTFLPILAGMFFFLAFLEDSGYMARAAFVMDRFMQALGLPGKSFVPMIVGFGCNVPAVMGARSLEGKRDRVLTILMMPFMSCGARLAIFAVFASAFFPSGGQNIIFLLYVTGIVAAILTGLLLRKTLLFGKPSPMVMELPPYHMPRFVSMCRHTWPRLNKFILRAGRVIVPVCVLIGGLNAITFDGRLVQGQEGSQHSVLSQVGRVVTPVLAPMGVAQDNWPATVGLVTGVLAKEVVIGTLNTLYSQEAGLKLDESHFNLWRDLKAAALTIPANLSQLGSALKNPWVANEAPHDMSKTAYGLMVHRFDGRIGAFAYLLFILLYFPCISTMAATRRELNKGWAVFSVWWSTSFAYAAAVMVYQALTFVRHPLLSSLWIAGMLVYLISVIFSLRFKRFQLRVPEERMRLKGVAGDPVRS
ncbi:MAG: Fe(2+) transporter permease subunit FeoB [Coxiellaceae bacterium]|nr:Fe(2+) transporter permease subunit FeoB [Coxiellaceae bacterium]